MPAAQWKNENQIEIKIILSKVEESDAGVRVCWDQEGETLILTHFYVFYHGRHYFAKGESIFCKRQIFFLQKEKVFFQRSGFVIVGGRQSRRQVQQGRDYFILMPFHGNFVVILLSFYYIIKVQQDKDGHSDDNKIKHDDDIKVIKDVDDYRELLIGTEFKDKDGQNDGTWW